MRKPSRPRHSVAVFVSAALPEERLWETTRLRSAYQRNDYIGWITGAKLPQTSQRRHGKCGMDCDAAESI